MKQFLMFVQLIIALSLSCSAFAQDATMADLRAVASRLKLLKTYSYESITNAVFPNGKKDQKVTTLYMDGDHKRLCYRNAFQMLLLTDKWAYRADHRTRQVSIFGIARYNDKYRKVLPEAEAVFKSDLAAGFMDSVILKSGKLVSARRNGDVVTFDIRFPASSYVRAMVIAYNYAKLLPESIRISSFYKEGTGGKGTAVETICGKYTTAVPESVFDVRQYFSVQRGKPVLAQFKGYKVYSIL